MSVARWRRCVAVVGLAVAACSRNERPATVTSTTVTLKGAPVAIYTLSTHNMELRVAEYGATILSLRVPDRQGHVDDVVLGFDSLAEYTRSPRYLGAVVGRYGNRIAHGRFTLDGRTYQLATNNGPNHLHGGVRGFDKVIWKGEPFTHGDTVGVTMRYTSRDGEEGYPGKLPATVTYTLRPDHSLEIHYEATTDAPTPINLTQHSFFNLAGAGTGDVLGHQLTLFASHYTPIDSTSIPTGEIAPVAGTPFDFRVPTAIGAHIAADDRQIKMGEGYNHNFVLDRTGPGLFHAAHVSEPTSGRTLDIYTTEPGVQFFTANSLDGTTIGKGGRPYLRHYGLCLETQHFPDSPNEPQFPSAILRPGETYRSTTVYAFGVQR